MTSLVTEEFPSNFIRSPTELTRSRMNRDSTTPTRTSIIKHVHDTSLVSLAYNFASRVSRRQESYEKFSASLLKNKSLLVPTRLALKRQRAAIKSPTLQYEPVRSETFQIELGNPGDITTSNHINQLREDTPHTLPKDISLLYR